MKRFSLISGILLGAMVLLALSALLLGRGFPLFFRSGKIIILLLAVAMTPALLSWLRRL